MAGVQQIHYSLTNPYASDYYNACNKFENTRDKVLKYERANDDRESAEYKKLMQEFTYWDAKVPETSNIAGAYEDKLAEMKEQENQCASNQQNNYRTLDYFA